MDPALPSPRTKKGDGEKRRKTEMGGRTWATWPRATPSLPPSYPSRLPASAISGATVGYTTHLHQRPRGARQAGRIARREGRYRDSALAIIWGEGGEVHGPPSSSFCSCLIAGWLLHSPLNAIFFILCSSNSGRSPFPRLLCRLRRPQRRRPRLPAGPPSLPLPAGTNGRTTTA